MSRRVALIMAGGGGTRLWPASTAERPKQLIDPQLQGTPASNVAVAHDSSLLAQTLDRVLGEVSETWVVTAADQAASLAAALPRLDRERLIVEPYGRNTAPCVGLSLVSMLGSGELEEHDTLIILPADHHIADADKFRCLLRAACAHASHAKTIVTLGIAPSYAATGFGYIHRAAAPVAAVQGDEGIATYAVQRFVEKPDSVRAAQFLSSGEYLWNAGIFICHVGRLAAEFERLCPRLWEALGPVATAARSSDARAATDAANRAYRSIEAVPLDVAVMEKTPDLRVIEASIGWTDLGSWRAVFELCAKDNDGNAVAYAGPTPVLVDSHDCLVWSEAAQVGVVGLRDVAVVVSGGQVLVCPIDRAQEVRSIVERLRRDQAK